MYHNTITVFNYHEKTNSWYTTVFSGVNLIEGAGASSTSDCGLTNSDAVEVIIHVSQEKAAKTIIYEPFVIVDNDGNGILSDDHNMLNYKEPETDKRKRYIGPKAFSRLEDPSCSFTFAPEVDFFAVGNFHADNPILDDGYNEGLYHAMNDVNDCVYKIKSAVFYSLIPHFEIGGM